MDNLNTYLNTYLSKNIIKIIFNYNDISTDNLRKIKPKYKYLNYKLNTNYTVLDIIIKCLQLGFKGFYLYKNKTPSIYKYIIENINDTRIKIYNNEDYVRFHIENINDNGHFVPIYDIEGVIEKKWIE